MGLHIRLVNMVSKIKLQTSRPPGNKSHSVNLTKLMFTRCYTCYRRAIAFYTSNDRGLLDFTLHSLPHAKTSFSNPSRSNGSVAKYIVVRAALL